MDIWKAKHNLIPDIFLFSDVYSWETQDGPGAKLVTFSFNVYLHDIYEDEYVCCVVFLHIWCDGLTRFRWIGGLDIFIFYLHIVIKHVN